MRVRDRLAVATYRRALRVFLWIAVVMGLARVARERFGGARKGIFIANL